MIRPWLWMPAHLAHKVSPYALSLLGSLQPYQSYRWRPVKWRHLDFQNPLGLAAGADKNARNIRDWWTLGVGFVEVGTITPKPQGPNPGRIVSRIKEKEALWNRVGFPSEGSDIALKRLKKLPRPHFAPVFVNIGKNRATPNENAVDDYKLLVQKFAPVADALVINISSPNTPGLRDLQTPAKLMELLTTLRETCDQTADRPPLLLKLSPDLSQEELQSCLEVSLLCKIDGWILSNTTLSRPDNIPFPKEGGVSGKPLAPRAKEILRWALDFLGPRGSTRREDKLLVSCGGILTPAEVLERLEMGADLVQVYTALIFKGPYFFRSVARVVHDKSASIG